MVNKADWDSNERNRNKQNDLYKYLAALTRHQQQMIKGIRANQTSFYLSLEQEDFRKHLNDSLTLAELNKLGEEEKKFRDKLIKDIMAVWRRHQEYLKEVHEEQHNLDKIAMIKPLLDRFDLVFTFKDNRDEAYNMEYAQQKAEMENRPRPDYTPYLVKHIMYAKQRYPKPRFSEEATAMLNQYYVDVRKRFGSPRIRETIFRIAQNLARMKLKDVVDAADAKETMSYYNIILQELEMVVPAVSRNPREEAYEKCLEILMGLVSPIAFEELIKRTCERNEQVAKYIGKMFKLEHNIKLRPILTMLLNHSHVKQVQMKPYVLQYIHDGPASKTESETETMVKTHMQASDVSDVSDVDTETCGKKSEENISLQKNIFETFHESSKTASDASYTSDSSGRYDHLILEERTESGHTIYRCKEHPDMIGMPYYDLKGIMVNHFECIHEQLESFKKGK